MTIKAVRIKKNIALTQEKEREVKIMLIILALFAAGMIIGASIMKDYTVSDDLTVTFKNIFSIFTQSRSGNNAATIFLNSFSVNIIFMAVLFFSGINLLGIPIVISMPIIRGLGYGMLSGYLINTYRMNGLGYYLLTIFFGGVIAVITLSLSCMTSIIMSSDILAVVFNKKQADKSAIISYLKHYLFFFFGCVVASTIDTVLVKFFSYLFEF